ncbi:MAG: hypothetical protein ACRCS3_14560 [Paracoccaceae bacterium]
MDRITAYSLSLRQNPDFSIMEAYFMDTRAFSMARSLRNSAGALALALGAVTGPAFALDGDDSQITVPFSSLSYSAQQEIAALQREMIHSGAPNQGLFPIDEPVARDLAPGFDVEPVMLDGRRVRINWAVGVYR